MRPHRLAVFRFPVLHPFQVLIANWRQYPYVRSHLASFSAGWDCSFRCFRRLIRAAEFCA
jgi:hypothetical protein